MIGNRDRSCSAYEEANITDFINSCVNFESNVTFHTVDEGRGFVQACENVAQKTVLLLGSESEASKSTAVEDLFPYYTKELAVLIESSPTGAMHVVQITPAARILVGKVPTTASRHNCPARPDVIERIVREAVSQKPAAVPVGPLDIYCLNENYGLSVAAAISRSSNTSFSAKKGLAKSGYLNKGRRVRVMIRAKDLTALSVSATMIQLCQRLVDAPTNLLDTITFTEIATKWVDKLKADGVDVGLQVVKGEDLREQGYGGIYGTGKAAEFPPHMVTLSYKPKAGIAPKDKIAFVGKGVVYDTGGLSIKDGANMVSMKHDMGGAAAVFCGLLGLAMIGSPVEVHSTLCLADNAIGPRSQRNDDILRLKSGITIEVNNTDAEGRLVLSDGVYHASAELPYTPSIIVDMATLTGAQGVATGKYHAAIFSNTEEAETRFLSSGQLCGDLCYPVVYCPEFHNAEFASAVADYRNSVKNRFNAQVSCAAQFIGNSLAKNYTGHWVHVDLASPATRDEATGFGVALLMQTFAGEFF